MKFITNNNLKIFCLVLIVFCVSFNAVADDFLYSDKQVHEAEQKMKESCAKIWQANYEYMEKIKAMNSALNEYLKNKHANNKRTSDLIDHLNDDVPSLERFEHECKSNTNDYGRMVNVNADLANKKFNLPLPEVNNSQSRPVNCISNKIGDTIYTNCN